MPYTRLRTKNTTPTKQKSKYKIPGMGPGTYKIEV